MPKPTPDQLQAWLTGLQQGTLPYHEIFGAIYELGSAQIYEAVPIIERFLIHDDPEFRRVALQSLAFDFRLKRHRQTAIDMLQHDPDVYVRMMAAAALGSLARDNEQAATVHLLARIAADAHEDEHVRRNAYVSMVLLLHPEDWPSSDLARSVILDSGDIDWDLVNSHLTDAGADGGTDGGSSARTTRKLCNKIAIFGRISPQIGL